MFQTVLSVALCASVIHRVLDNVVCQKQITYLLGQGLSGRQEDKIVSSVTMLALVMLLLCNSCQVWRGCIGLVCGIVKYTMGNT